MKKIILFSLLLVGCTTTNHKVAEYNEFDQRVLIQTHQYKTLLAGYEKDFARSKIKNKDFLMNRLNYATVLHYDGQWVKSNEVLKECQKMIENYDQSFQEEILGVLSAEAVKFQLEDFEVLNISLLKALNYLLIGSPEDALVEMRRMDRISRMLVYEGNKSLLEQTQYTTYLSGILFEHHRSQDPNALDSAYIDYKRLQKVYPKHPYLRFDLYRMASLLNLPEDQEYWRNIYPIPEVYQKFLQSKNYEKQTGEIIVIFESGLAPKKDTHPQYKNIPVYIPRPQKNLSAHIKVNNEELGTTVPLANLEALMLQSLENKYASAIGAEKAKEITGAILTIGLAPVGVLFSALNSALKTPPDTRAWDMLPSHYHIARIPMKAGSYEVELYLPGSEITKTYSVKVEALKKTTIFISSHD